MNKKVSVVVPTYNNEKYIKQCLDSLLGQTYKYLDIVIIDRNSTDLTFEIIKEYQKKYPDVIKFKRLEKNGGFGEAIIEGLRMVEGEYICLCNGDDWFHLERIEKMVKYLEDNSDKFLVLTNYLDFDEERSRVEWLGFDSSFLKKKIQNPFFIIAKTQYDDMKLLFVLFMVKSSIIKKEIFITEIKTETTKWQSLQIDYDYPKGFGFINEPLYFRRIYPTKEKNCVSDCILLLPFYRKLLKVFCCDSSKVENNERYISMIKKRIIRGYVDVLIKEGYNKEAFEFYKMMVVYEPFYFRIFYKTFMVLPILGKFIIRFRHSFVKFLNIIRKYMWRRFRIRRALRVLIFCFPKGVAPSVKEKLKFLLGMFIICFPMSERLTEKIEGWAYGIKSVFSNKEEKIYEKNGVFYVIPNEIQNFRHFISLIYCVYLMKQYENPPVIVDEGDIVIDCGACIGDTSLFFAQKAGKKGRVIAIEPEKKNYQILEKVRILNEGKAAPIIPIRAAVYKEDCYLELDISSGAGSHTISSYYLSKEVILSKEKVQAFKIDTLVKLLNLERVDFIKMDIEGAEVDGLLGAEDVIKKFKPKLAICSYHHPNASVEIRKILLEYNPNYKFKEIKRGEKILFAWNENEKRF